MRRKGKMHRRNEKEDVRLSKSLSKLLRHDEQAARRCGMRTDGFVSLDVILTLQRFKRLLGEDRNASIDRIKSIVENNDKKRFSLKLEEDGALFIRANQGHSIPWVEVDLKRVTSAHECGACVHGTTLEAWEKFISKEGLCRMARQHVHMALALPGEDGVISGARSSSQVFVYVDAGKLLKAGIPIFLSSNGVVLCPGVGERGMISPEFFVKVMFCGKKEKGRRIEWFEGNGGGRDTAVTGTVASAAAAAAAASSSSSSSSATALSSSSARGASRGANLIFDFFVVLDFEATCDDEGRVPKSKQEVIEFPAVLLDGKTLEPVDELQVYVKPKIVPHITKFCTELTGITQETIDTRGVAFEDALQQHVLWMMSHGLDVSQGDHRGKAARRDTDEDGDDDERCDKSFLIVTCGDWDLLQMLPRQLSHLEGKVRAPRCYKRWLNVKNLYNSLWKAGKRPGKGRGMAEMLRDSGLELKGRHHSGIDDCRNIGRLLQKMLTVEAAPLRADMLSTLQNFLPAEKKNKNKKKHDMYG